MRGLATSAAEKDLKLPVCIWSTLLQNQEKTFSMKTDSSLPGANLWGENPETFCQLGTKEAQLKRKSPPAQYLRISIGCRKGSRCGQNFHKKSGSTGRILNKYIHQFKQTLGSSRPSAAGPKCTPDPNKTLSSLQKFSWVTWVSYGIRVLCSPLDVLIYVTIWTNMSEKGLVVWAPFTQEVRPRRKEEF